MVCPRENVSFVESGMKRLRPGEGQRSVWVDGESLWLLGEFGVA